MRIIKQIKTDNLTGTITYEMLPYATRTKKVQEIYGNISVNPEEKSGNNLSDYKAEFEIGEKITQLMIEQVKAVNIVAKGDEGEEFTLTSVDELSMMQEGVAIINEISATILNGYQLSKKMLNSSTDK